MRAIWILLASLFKPDYIWEYGECRERKARRHKLSGNVQFVIWQAGEHGHTSDYWVDFNSWWWKEFKPIKK